MLCVIRSCSKYTTPCHAMHDRETICLSESDLRFLSSFLSLIFFFCLVRENRQQESKKGRMQGWMDGWIDG